MADNSFWNAVTGVPLPDDTPSPPPVQTLSDGSTINFGNAPADQRQTAIEAAENAIDKQNMDYAKLTNAPYTPTFKDAQGNLQEGTKTYSSERPYANNLSGKMQAYADHTQIGSAVNQYFDPKLAAAAPYVQPAARVATNVVAGPADLVGGGINVLRHTLGNEQERQVPDIPSLGMYLRKQAGIPELPPDAPAWQRYGEGAASAILSGGVSGAGRALATGELPALTSVAGTTLKSGAQGLGSQAGSDVGGAVFGEPGSYVGGLLGGGASLGKVSSALLGRQFANPNAGNILSAAEALRTQGHPDFPDPSFRTMANPTGQRAAAVIGSLPFVGGPVERANEATRSGIQNVRDTAAQAIAGGPMPVGGASEESMGHALTTGAQQGIQDIKARQAAQWDPINQAMANRTVDVAPVVATTNQMLEGNQTTPANEAAVRAVTGQLSSMAPGGANYDPNIRGPVPPLPQPTMDVPWSAAKDFRSGLKYQLGSGEVQVPGGMIADVKDATTAAMQDAARRAGLGNQFDVASRSYAAQKPILDALYGVGGRPLGDTGQFQGVPGEKSAYTRAIGSNLQSPQTMQTFAENIPNWNVAAGQQISRLGTTKQGDFRPEEFYNDWMQKTGQGARDLLTQGPSGAPSAQTAPLENAATIAQNFSTPTSRHGLMSSLGMGRAIELGLHALSAGAGNMLGGPIGGAAGAGLSLGVPYAMAKGMENPMMKQVMAGRSATPFIAQNVYNALPKIAAVQEQDNVRQRLLAAAGRPAY